MAASWIARLAALALLFLPLSPASAQEGPVFLRGDANADGIVSAADVLCLVRFFQNGQLPRCADAADVDDSGALEITDLVNLFHFLYVGAQYPAPPSHSPGVDPTPDELGCSASRPGGGGGLLTDGDEDDGQVIDFIEFLSRRVEGFPGESGMRVPILLSNALALDGFTVSVYADPQKVWLEKIELARPTAGRPKPAVSQPYTLRINEGYLARTVFMDYLPPYDGNRIPRSLAAPVATLFFGLSPEVKPGERTKIVFSDIPPGGDLRPAPINELCSDGLSVRPASDPRGLEVVIYPASALFLRGDTNRDQVLNITDVIIILRYLFAGEILSCLDPADVDDDGKVDITDATSLAHYLFGSGNAPQAPFPNAGLDPSSDELDDCR